MVSGGKSMNSIDNANSPAIEPLSEILERNIDQSRCRHEHADELTGLPSGFLELDKTTFGLQKSSLIVLGARPGMGKTSFALNIAANAAKQSNACVLFFSLEMSNLLLGQRLLSAEAEVDSRSIRDGCVFGREGQMRKVIAAKETLAKTRIFVSDKSGITITEMLTQCRDVADREGGIDLIVVDYLQLVNFDKIAALMRMFKQLAHDMECPVLVLSQLSRKVERRYGHRPQLSDLLGSGEIEDIADIVMFLYKLEDRGDDPGPDPEKARVLSIAKHRNGETRDIILGWSGQHAKFVNYDPHDIFRDFPW
jgi:replicative DNA helicase